MFFGQKMPLVMLKCKDFHEIQKIGVRDAHVLIVFPAPPEGLSRQLLNGGQINAALRKRAPELFGHVLSNTANDADIGKESGRARKMSSRPPKHILVFPVRGLYVVNGYGADNGD